MNSASCTYKVIYDSTHTACRISGRLNLASSPRQLFKYLHSPSNIFIKVAKCISHKYCIIGHILCRQGLLVLIIMLFEELIHFFYHTVPYCSISISFLLYYLWYRAILLGTLTIPRNLLVLLLIISILFYIS